ncbi:MAG: arginine-binding protein [Pseudomonadota bacterium]|jgi:ABC-type amino acid transport substrate-binding protein
MNRFLSVAIALFLWAHTPVQANNKTPMPPASPRTYIAFGTDATYPPLVNLDDARRVSGFETELLKTVCRNLNWACSFSHEEWDNLVPALRTGKINAIYGGIAITKARQEQFLFTVPLIDESLAGIVSHGESVLPFTEEGLKDKKIGVQTGSTFAHYLSTAFPNVRIKRYVSIQDALLDLTAKRIDAVFGDTPVLRYFTRSLPEDKQDNYTVTGIDLNPENLSILGTGYGVAFNKNPESEQIVKALNAQIKAFQKKPAYDVLKIQFGIN